MEKLINPTLTNLEDKNGRNPREVFTKEHKALTEAGEKWMKDTSKTCMIVSTLIALFVFAVAFNAPGGYDYGVPNLAWNRSFMVFVISDALALFSSITSLLMFISILTLRYAEEDFHVLLPKKLIINGLASLFFSIATMMVTFGPTFYILLNGRLDLVIAIPMFLLAPVPVSIFVLFRFPFFIEMCRSTFGNRIFHPQSIW